MSVQKTVSTQQRNSPACLPKQNGQHAEKNRSTLLEGKTRASLLRVRAKRPSPHDPTVKTKHRGPCAFVPHQRRAHSPSAPPLNSGGPAKWLRPSRLHCRLCAQSSWSAAATAQSENGSRHFLAKKRRFAPTSKVGRTGTRAGCAGSDRYVPQASADTKIPAASTPSGTQTTASRSPPPQAAAPSPGFPFLRRRTAPLSKPECSQTQPPHADRLPEVKNAPASSPGAIYVSSIAFMSEALRECQVPAPRSKRELTTARATATPAFLERRLWLRIFLRVAWCAALAADRRSASSGPRLAPWEACVPKCRHVLTNLSETPSATLTVGVH